MSKQRTTRTMTASPPTIAFTVSGKIVGKVKGPVNANDLHVKWSSGVIKFARWSINGDMTGPVTGIKIPKGANDLHLLV